MAQYKEKAVESLNYAKAQLSQSYTANADAFNAAFETCVAAITAATTKEAIETAQSTLSATINALDTDAKIRGTSMTEYTTYYGAKVNELTALNLDDTKLAAATAELAAISTEYIGTNDNPGTLMTCAMDVLDTTLAAAKTELDGVITKYSSSLDDYKATLETQLTEYKASALAATEFDETNDATLYAGINSITIDFTGVTDNDGADAALAAAKSVVDGKIALYSYKYNSTDGLLKQLEDYAATKVATLKISASDYEANYKMQMDQIISDFDDDVFEATSTSDADADLDSAKALVDSLISDIKAATEVIVTFKNGDTTVGTESVLVGEKVTRPAEDPTQDGYVFKGWFAEEACTITFDFENTAITTATTIYAGWYDTYALSNIKNSLADFTTLSASANIKTTKAYGDFSISNGSYTQFKEQNGYISFFSGNTVTFTVLTDGAIFMLSYQGNNSSRYVNLTSTNPNFTAAKQYTNGTYLKASTSSSQYVQQFQGQSVTLETSAKGWLIFENLLAGTYTMTVDTDESGKTGIAGNAENKIERMRLLDVEPVSKTITGITADVQSNGGSITVSKVYLLDDATTPIEYEITTGYTVEVRDSADQVVENSGLTDGETYTVIVKYGSYTKYTTTVTMPSMA